MNAHHGEHPITTFCGVLNVSPSGFYDWRKRKDVPSARTQRRAVLDARVKHAFERAKERSGSPRLVDDLADAGYNVKTVAASMRRQGLRAKAARKFKATTHSKHNLPVAENLLKQDFSATKRDEKWVSDITYLWTDEGWMYLAVVIDLYSRLVVGWAMSERMTTQLVIDALHAALWRRKMPSGVIVHSDRGSQYCAKDYQRLLRHHGLQCSMSGKGNCYDNACAESFFHTLKVEAIHGERFSTRDDIRECVFLYIEVDYNRNRRHSFIGNISPALFEARKVA